MKIKFAFFGTDKFSVGVLDELQRAGLVPSLIVTVPDRPSGRGNKMHASAVKEWAVKNSINYVQPEKLDAEFVAQLDSEKWDLFALASYGKIIPQTVLDIPAKGTLNVHPSLLPKYRGASPIESAILADDKTTGVTIMQMDDKMDHGPIVRQEQVFFTEWTTRQKIEDEMAQLGGQILANAIPEWVSGNIEATEQNHTAATFTKKMIKEDGQINLEGDARENFLKIKAYNPWPGAFFFIKHGEKEIRIKVLDADFVDSKLVIKNVIPEGRKEMSYEDFKKGFIRDQI